jgi:cobalt-zinc-cadmium efflux system membrane fusion protein
MKHRLKIPSALAIAAAAAIAAVSTGCSSSKSNPHKPTAAARPRDVTLTAAQRKRIRMYNVAPSTFRKTISTTGVVHFDQNQATKVLAPFSGPVTRLLVTVGEKVKRGQPMAMVNSPDFASAIGAYRKALAAARIARKFAAVDKDLLKHHAISPREEEHAQIEAASAAANRDAALQALVALDADPQTIKDIQQGRPLAHAAGVIRSPISGTVVAKSISPGQLLESGATSCFTVADLSRVWVMARIFDADIASVSLGDPAEVATGIDGKTFSGKVTNVSAEVDPATRSVAARVLVKNPKSLLKKRMYVSVRIRSRRPSAGLLVPVSAVLRDDENLPFVYVADADDTFTFARRRVTLGYRTGNRFDITSGLKTGEKVVTEGSIFVRFIQSQ